MRPGRNYARHMRLVTWKLGHHLHGHDSPDGVVEALTALEPDIAILAEHLPRTGRQKLLEALATIGLEHQFAPSAGQLERRMLIASRMNLVPGMLDDGTSGSRRPRGVLHVYSPGGSLDLLGLRMSDSGTRASNRQHSWQWLLHAASALKHRRAVILGDFELDTRHDHAAAQQQLRPFLGDGWQRAVQADGSDYCTTGDAGLRLDHAFLSPSILRIDARYALAAGGIRLAGSKDAVSGQPALVVDLQ
jgi:hypothetical protein